MTRSGRWTRRSLVVVVIVGLLVGVWLLFVVKSYSVPITSYRVVDDQTLVVQVVAGSRSWCRLANTAETASDIQVSAECVDWLPLPGTAVGQTLEYTVQLDEPLNDRVVIDGDGVAVALQKCSDNVCAQ